MSAAKWVFEVSYMADGFQRGEFFDSPEAAEQYVAYILSSESIYGLDKNSVQYREWPVRGEGWR